jgi:hypothetical protein
MQLIENKRNTITKPSVTAKNRESEEREDADCRVGGRLSPEKVSTYGLMAVLGGFRL